MQMQPEPFCMHGTLAVVLALDNFFGRLTNFCLVSYHFKSFLVAPQAGSTQVRSFAEPHEGSAPPPGSQLLLWPVGILGCHRGSRCFRAIRQLHEALRICHGVSPSGLPWQSFASDAWTSWWRPAAVHSFVSHVEPHTLSTGTFKIFKCFSKLGGSNRHLAHLSNKFQEANAFQSRA